MQHAEENIPPKNVKNSLVSSNIMQTTNFSLRFHIVQFVGQVFHRRLLYNLQALKLVDFFLVTIGNVFSLFN
jgi:hypothetical protein